MSKSLQEWFDSDKRLKDLKKNLDINIRNLAGDLSKEDQCSLLRTNLIMVRQCLNQYGIGLDKPAKTEAQIREENALESIRVTQALNKALQDLDISVKLDRKDMLCEDCGYEWCGEEGHCPDCDSVNTQEIFVVARLKTEKAPPKKRKK